MTTPSNQLSLYIHWPFCVSKCPYCDFNSHIRQSIDENLWQQAYTLEMERYAQLTGPRTLKTIFFGGGTPSLMNPRMVEGILETANRLWPFSNSIEITLEANPNSVEVEKFQTIAHAGINRVSIGIQSFNQRDLKFLGRSHSVDEGKKAIETGQKVFNNVSFDLIYARPNQSVEAWQNELQEALAFKTPHLSLYQLTIEPGTAFYHQHARGDFTLPDEDIAATLYELTRDLCAQKGLDDYEISNYALPGFESQHNLAYWRYHDYVGIGPGAHGRITVNNNKFATRQYRAPQTWIEKACNTSASHEFTPLTLEEQADEMLLMGLRLKEPFPLNSLPIPWVEFLNISALTSFHNRKMLDLSKDCVKLSLNARQCLNELILQIRS